MNEREWLTSSDPARMLDAIRRWPEQRVVGRDIGHNCRYSDRLLRLFACACCRQVWHLLKDERSRRAVEVAERYADGDATEADLTVSRSEAADCRNWTAESPKYYPAWLAHVVTAEQVNSIVAVVSRQTELSHLVPTATQADLLRDIVGNPWRPVTLCGMERKPFHDQHAHVDSNGSFWLETECPKCAKLRTPTVKRLATAAYQERGRVCETCKNGYPGWGIDASGRALQADKNCPSCHGTGRVEDGRLDKDRLKVLADALEDAGCEEKVKCTLCGGLGGWGGMKETEMGPEYVSEICQLCKGEKVAPNPILTYLRSDGVHVRGMWSLDLLLGKE